MKSSSPEGEEVGGLLDEKDLVEIERTYRDGLTAAQVIELFLHRGVKFSEATFRKYVQLGLLPRSRRVGRKGKHQGSMGLYPAVTVRRLNDIKKMMAESYTIEEIQRSFLRFTDEIEKLDRGFKDLLQAFRLAAKSESDANAKRTLVREIEDVERLSKQLVERIERVERLIIGPLERAAKARAFSSGARGGAGDLL